MNKDRTKIKPKRKTELPNCQNTKIIVFVRCHNLLTECTYEITLSFRFRLLISSISQYTQFR